jgi:hypothetical protein
METRINDIHLRQISFFSLVGLLVVIAIIGILILLFLTAIQQAREPARNPQGMNHPDTFNIAFCHCSVNSVPFTMLTGKSISRPAYEAECIPINRSL